MIQLSGLSESCPALIRDAVQTHPATPPRPKNMPPEPEFAPEHSKAERIRVIMVGVVCGASIVFAANTWLWPWLHAFINWAPCHTVFAIQGQTLLWYGLFVGLPLQAALLVAALCGWRGYKVLRDGQCPPRHEKVYRPTRIRRGTQARLIGYLHLTAFLPLLALSVWGGFQAQQLASTTAPKASLCTADPPR